MCGVFGAFSPRGEQSANVGEDVYLALIALQHRGQDAAGFAWSDRGGRVDVIKRQGLVHEALSQKELAAIDTCAAIGHVRYPTTGMNSAQNSQPIGANYAGGSVAVAHNGNITNYGTLRSALEHRGAIFQSTCDSEVILHLLSHQPDTPPINALQKALGAVRGAYSLVALMSGKLVAARDPWGFRPLSLGRRGDSWYVTSETCAFTLLGISFVRDIEPGEILVIGDDSIQSLYLPKAPEHRRLCSFEFVYIARPDSVIEGVSVYRARKRMGALLSERAGEISSTSSERPEDADFVTTLPDSGTTAALGYAYSSGKPYEGAVVRNRYVGRTFIQPTQRVRELGVRIKLSPCEELIHGQSLVLVDDSLVRGTTAGLVVSMIRTCGARAIHLSISSPPVRHPCWYGIDTPSRGELAAATRSLDEIAAGVGADTLRYLRKEDMIEAIGIPGDRLCTACFDGDYLDKATYEADLSFLR